jgi:hypothetical protein
MRHNDVGSDRVLHTAVATSLTTSTLCSHSTLNNLRNRHIHRFYTTCELSATLQQHHGLSEYVLQPRRTPRVVRNCYQRDGRYEVRIPAGTSLSLEVKLQNTRPITQLHLVARLPMSEAMLRLPLWLEGIQKHTLRML